MISSLAVVHPEAKLGDNVSVAPFAIIEEDVVIDADVQIGAHAVVKSGTRIGQGTRIYEGAIVGGDPQDLKYNGEQTSLVIGKHVQIREFCTINRGTAATGVTTIGDDALIMAYSHVAHDCIIHKGAILANNVQVAGHVEIEQYATVGGMSAIQQFIRIGSYAYIGGGTLIRKDVPPYTKAAHEPLRFIGVNKIGMQRRGLSSDVIHDVEEIYKLLFVKHDNISIGIREAEARANTDSKRMILQFIKASKTGIIRGLG